MAVDLTPLVRPRSIAVIGASATKNASGNQALRQLRSGGFTGEVHVVHPSAGSIADLPTVARIESLPRNLDTALVSVAAPGVVETVGRLADIGCRSAIVPAVGLTPADRQSLEAIAGRTGMALCGPNTMGLLNVSDSISMLFWEGVLDDLAPGPIAIVAQSGGACLGIVKSTERAGFSRILAGGNEWVTSTADYLRWLASDDQTSAVAVVIESIADVTDFVDAVRLLRDHDKPLVALHVGRTAAGATATQAHTSALIGRPEVYEAFFTELDVPVARDYDEVASVLDAYCLGSAVPKPQGDRIAVLTVSGGIAALAADLASDRSVPLPEFGPDTKARLVSILPGSTANNPFDSGGGAGYTGEKFRDSILAISDDPNVDSVLVVLDGQWSLSTGEVAYAEEDFVAVADASRAERGVPIVVASTGTASTHPHWRTDVCPETPIVRGIPNGLFTLRALAMNSRAVPRDLGNQRRRDGHGEDSVAPASATMRLLSEYGLTGPRACMVASVDEAVAMLPQLSMPIVVKVVSPDISHRSDVGGVVMNVRDEESLRAACSRIQVSVTERAPHARFEGFELQEQVGSPLEAMLGVVNDPVFGPVVSVGLGGVLVEILQDRAFALAPVSEARARALIARTHLERMASGYRNLVEPTSLEPLAAALAALSRLATDHADSISALDLNPVLLTESQGTVMVVDALLFTREGSTP